MTKCPFHCGQQVFYHTNGNGDSVYFDNIGWPWEVHDCWAKYWKEEQTRRRLTQYLGNVLNQDLIQQEILVGVITGLSKRIGRKTLTEIEVAQFMKLSVKRFRTLYGHLYYLNKNKFVVLQGNVDSKNLEKSELQKLMLRRQVEWGTSSIPDLKFGQFGIYGASEEEIATCLGYSTSEFRARYGHIYAATSNGIRFKSKLDEIDKKRKIEKPRKKETDLSKPKNNGPSLLKDNSGFKQVSKPKCPHCEGALRYPRDLGIHIQRDHALSLSNSILHQAERSQGQGNILCSYCCKSGPAIEITQHLKVCKNFQNSRMRKSKPISRAI
ncbi:hypothetical protein NIES30_10840 [Phormidium tenue NIES-30]|uniref:Uncharacterized protein n=2 Tax=Phormidium tenue TaxID=126344 RepID=A0A1U7J5C4_9CYAN|nr:hypothetical protein NIES30_10840 [Phormidium tenue NIES-30]